MSATAASALPSTASASRSIDPSDALEWEDPDSEELQLQLEEVTKALDAALHVNKILNEQYEKHTLALQQCEAERNQWQARSEWLCKRLIKAQQKSEEAAGLGGAASPQDEAQQLLQLLEQSKIEAEISSAPCTANMPVTPSPVHEQLLAALIAKGKQAGWLIEPSEVHRGELLGQGMFGVTYRARWRGAQVALKMVRISADSELTSFLREVEALSNLRHPHVVPFLGAAMQGPDTFWLLSELMECGTLAHWLYPSSQQPQPPQRRQQSGGGAAAGGSSSSSSSVVRPQRTAVERLRLAHEVAQGMEAIETCRPPLLHRDLKPSNVFVDGAGHARVGDFGLARRVLPGERAHLTGETGTYQYMAPEVMRHEVYDSKADVWSWGVLAVEVLSGKRPYVDTYLTPVQIACAVADEQLQPEIPASLDIDLQALLTMVLCFDPELRPSFTSINAELRAIADKLAKAQAQPPSGLLQQLQHSLATSWGGVMSRIYGTPAYTAAAGAAVVLPAAGAAGAVVKGATAGVRPPAAAASAAAAKPPRAP